jgi:hypothetical protein
MLIKTKDAPTIAQSYLITRINCSTTIKIVMNANKNATIFTINVV